MAKKIASDSPENIFTFVVPKKETVPKYINSGLNTVGIQIPKFYFSLGMLNELQVPVIGTSANISGLPVVYSIKNLLKQLDSVGRYPDLILDAGELFAKKPSRVIEIIGENKFVVLRK